MMRVRVSLLGQGSCLRKRCRAICTYSCRLPVVSGLHLYAVGLHLRGKTGIRDPVINKNVFTIEEVVLVPAGKQRVMQVVECSKRYTARACSPYPLSLYV